jgi:hypothetical protein
MTKRMSHAFRNIVSSFLYASCLSYHVLDVGFRRDRAMQSEQELSMTGSASVVSI